VLPPLRGRALRVVTQGCYPIRRSERAMSIICMFVNDFESVLATQ
jgi:hypothetical protein